MSLHLDLAALIEEHFGEHLEAPVDVNDALIAHFANGVTWKPASQRPTPTPSPGPGAKRSFASTPPRFTRARHPAQSPPHRRRQASPIRSPAPTRPWDNLQRVITTILDDPLLENPLPEPEHENHAAVALLPPHSWPAAS
jgi:hypothetical protein